jgi:hypothetical protein
MKRSPARAKVIEMFLETLMAFSSPFRAASMTYHPTSHAQQLCQHINDRPYKLAEIRIKESQSDQQIVDWVVDSGQRSYPSIGLIESESVAVSEWSVPTG